MRTIGRRPTAVLLVVLTMTALVLVGPGPVGAQDPFTQLGGTVTDDGAPVAGVSVDLFTADNDGNRLEWLRATTTGNGGGYEFVVDPGCYATTIIAPAGRTFTTGSRWSTASACLEVGQFRSDMSAQLEPVGDGDHLAIGTVVDGDGTPIDGLTIDLFVATADGNRGRYLRSTTSGSGDTAGAFAFRTPVGCYVATLIGDGDQVWEATGTKWLNAGFCVDGDDQTDQTDLGRFPVTVGPDAVVTIDVAVTAEGSTVGGVLVDIFRANGDGSRGPFIESFTTVEQVRTRQEFTAAEGCYVLTLVAAEDGTFAETGTRWLNRPFCLVDGQSSHRFDVELSLAPPMTCAAGAEFEQIFRDDFDGAGPDAHWSLFNSTGNAGFGLRRPSAVSVENGMLFITGAMEDGQLVSGGMQHDLSQTYGKYRFRVRTDADQTKAMSGEILTWPSSGVHPRDGENNIYSTLTSTVERKPFYSFIHKPFGSVADQTSFTHNADGSQFQTMTMEWTPDRLTITREGEGGPDDLESFVIRETAEDLIVDVPHRLSIQLDAWKNAVNGPVRMEVDWVEVHQYCGA